jgi:hypothetical protein
MGRIIFFVAGLFLTGWIIMTLTADKGADRYRQQAERINAKGNAVVMEKNLEIARQEAEANAPAAFLTLINPFATPVFIKAVNAYKKLTAQTNVYWTLNISADQRLETELPEGEYYLKIRYGTPGNYSYFKSEQFLLSSDAETIITLEKKPFGNFATTAISASSF